MILKDLHRGALRVVCKRLNLKELDRGAFWSVLLTVLKTKDLDRGG